MVKEKEAELCEVIKEFEETISELERNFATAKREVSRKAEQMIANVRQREREAILSLETIRQSRLERINAAKQEVESLDLKLGVIEDIPTVVNQSPIEGLDQTFQAGVEVEFTLCPKAADGVTINQADIKDQVELLVEPANDVTNVTVQEKEDGNLSLKFTPKVPGAYIVEVKINGEKLPTCTFSLTVKERELVIVGQLDLKFNESQEFKGPCAIAVNKQDDIVVVNTNVHCVYVFNKEGHCLRQIGKEGTDPGQFKYPTDVLFLNDNEILIADRLNNRIQHINIQTGSVLKTFGQKGEGKGSFRSPISICLDDSERIVVTEFAYNRIQVMSKEGETIFTIGDSGPRDSANHSVAFLTKTFSR
ncbi:protein lin-41-like [Stylophora pistillata]|nr:protein lin-41-like [Stylophora pistillata]